MTKARENSDYTGLAADIAAGDTAARAGRKNLIINGGFDVWQRGTSLTAASSYLADRWANGTSEAQSRQAFTVGQTEVDGNPTYYHRSGGGGSAYYGLDHKIENVGTLSGKEVTLSYWMKGSSAFTNAPYRGQNFGSGGSSGVEAALSTSSITTSWVRYTHTFTFPSISGKTVGASSFSQLNVFRANIANIVVDIANVQLELGSVATDFEHRSYGEILADCQRYFYNPLYNLGGSRGQFTLDYLVSSGNNGWITWIVPFPVSMRANSTFSHSLTPAKFLGSAAPADGADNFSFYIQNQGYAGLVGNGSIANLGGGGQYHGIVGTYYCSPSSTSASHIFIGNGCTFQFSAEL